MFRCSIGLNHRLFAVTVVYAEFWRSGDIPARAHALLVSTWSATPIFALAATWIALEEALARSRAPIINLPVTSAG